MLGACGKPARLSRTDVGMGTVVNVTLYLKDGQTEENGQRMADEILASVHALEEGMLSRRLETAELYRINESGGVQEGYALSKEMEELLTACMNLAQDAEGAFDVTLGALIMLWQMDELAAAEENVTIPTAQEIRERQGLCGQERMEIRDGKIYLQEGTILDLGSIGKGYALDHLKKLLEEDGGRRCEAGIFSLGGSILTYGSKPDKSKWRVAVVDPMHEGETIGVLELEGTWCVSTSGDYERYFEYQGKRYHHLLDPETGYPAESGVRSVTILSKSGLYGDALSTACFVLGREKGMALASKYGVEILVVDESGVLYLSEGMRQVFVPVADEAKRGRAEGLASAKSLP